MRRALAAASIVALLALPPIDADEGVRERNRAWVLAQSGPSWDPDAEAVLVSYQGVARATAAAALERVLDRMGDVDMGALTSAAAATQSFPAAGDVWLLEVGTRPCPVPTTTFTTLYDPPIDQQFWLYTGAYGYAASEVSIGGIGYAIEWTLKEAFTYQDLKVSYAGGSDFFCVSGFGRTFNFPFLDGVAQDLPA